MGDIFNSPLMNFRKHKTEISPLKEARKKKGFTIREVCEMLKTAPSLYADIENGKRRLFRQEKKRQRLYGILELDQDTINLVEHQDRVYAAYHCLRNLRLKFGFAAVDQAVVMLRKNFK